jgi:hypothetical protein
VTNSANASAPTTNDSAVRLALVPAGAGPHRLDGIWWPRSYDLARELPALLAALDGRWPHITRITVSRTLWRTGGSRLVLPDRVVHITRSDIAHRPGAICLLSYGVGRCDLLVVPPGTAPSEGDRLMSAVAGSEVHTPPAAGTRR